MQTNATHAEPSTHTTTHTPVHDRPLAARRTSVMELRAHALSRAALGWTRNESTHNALELLETSGLVQLEMSELRQTLAPGSERLALTWAGSRWSITQAGRAELDRLTRIVGPVDSDELATWEAAVVVDSTRVAKGIYAVTLANKARATVAKASEVQGGVARRGWYWLDRRGGVEGFKTKGDALASFRRYRG
jgi:hypothetical protein